MINRYIPYPVLVSALTIIGVGQIQSQIAFTGAYQQDFNVLGSDTSWLAGWNGVNTLASPSVPITLGITTGSTTSGGLYNVGSVGNSDRALGSLAGGTVVPRFGVQFQNTSGETFTGIQLDGVMEQWRSGNTASVNEALTFEYSFDAQGIDDSGATWHSLEGLDLLERLTDTTSGAAVDGDLPENQRLVNGTISDAMWVDQGLLTLRWTDINDTGSDGLYALDNFSISGVSSVPEPSTWALMGFGLLALFSRPLRR